MKKTILITGPDSRLKAKLIKMFLNSDYRVAGTVGSETAKSSSSSKDYTEIIWNNRSPLSAKDVVLQCRNTFEKLDEAITVFSSPQNNKPIHEISAADIENALDSNLKGNIYIIKELILYFQRVESGSLSLIHDIERGEVIPPLAAVETGSFSSLAESLFAFYQNERLDINAFISSSGNWEEYSDFIFQAVNGKTKSVHGKLYRFPEKSMFKSLGLSKIR